MSSSRTRRLLTQALGAIAIIGTAGVLWAHDFWIVPDAFQVGSGGTLQIRGQTGTRFPVSQSAVSPDRITEARLIGASSDEHLSDFSVSGKSLLIRHRPTTPGQRIVTVTLAPRVTRTTPERLKGYVALEGAPELAERYAREGAYPKRDSVTQIAGKFAKTIVEIGAGGPRAFAKAVGQALELVPLNDPATLRSGDTLVVRLLYHGRPVPGAQLRAGSAPSGITATSDSAQVAGAAATKDVAVETGPDGAARIALEAQGLWNVRTLHAASATNASDTWEVYFATLVFNVGSGSGASAPAGDSSDVAAIVQQFDAALAAGDSAAALALLADDVLVLESGGIETRAQYRSQHIGEDIVAARAMPSRSGPITVRLRGDVAWATGTSTRQGQSGGRQVNSVGATLMVLSRESAGWRIRAIHWSSRSRRPPGG